MNELRLEFQSFTSIWLICAAFTAKVKWSGRGDDDPFGSFTQRDLKSKFAITFLIVIPWIYVATDRIAIAQQINRSNSRQLRNEGENICVLSIIDNDAPYLPIRAPPGISYSTECPSLMRCLRNGAPTFKVQLLMIFARSINIDTHNNISIVRCDRCSQPLIGLVIERRSNTNVRFAWEKKRAMKDEEDFSRWISSNHRVEMERVDNDHRTGIHISKPLLVGRFDREMNDHVVHRLINWEETRRCTIAKYEERSNLYRWTANE